MFPTSSLFLAFYRLFIQHRYNVAATIYLLCKRLNLRMQNRCRNAREHQTCPRVLIFKSELNLCFSLENQENGSSGDFCCLGNESIIIFASVSRFAFLRVLLDVLERSLSCIRRRFEINDRTARNSNFTRSNYELEFLDDRACKRKSCTWNMKQAIKKSFKRIAIAWSNLYDERKNGIKRLKFIWNQIPLTRIENENYHLKRYGHANLLLCLFRETTDRRSPVHFHGYGRLSLHYQNSNWGWAAAGAVARLYSARQVYTW